MWYLLARSWWWWSVCLNIFKLLRKLLLLSCGSEREKGRRSCNWLVEPCALKDAAVYLDRDLQWPPEDFDLSPDPFNYLDIGVEGVFIFDKKMVNRFGVVIGIPHNVLMGLEW